MESFAQLPRPARYASWLLLAFTLVVIVDLYKWWEVDEEYFFGFLVPLFSGYIIYDRWPRMRLLLGGTGQLPRQDADARAFEASLKQPEPRFPSWLKPVLETVAFLVILGCGAAFLLALAFRAMEGRNLISSNLLTFGFAATVLSMVFLYSDRGFGDREVPLTRRLRLTSQFMFPGLIWILSVPLVGIIDDRIRLTLQNWVATINYHLFDLSGFIIVQQGSTLLLPKGAVGVEDACSGIRSLMACLFAGSFLAAAFLNSFPKKVALVACAMVSAFFLNIVRSAILTGMAYAHGPEGLDHHVKLLGMDLGNVHDFTGNAVLVVTLGALLGLVWLFSLRLEFEVPARNDRVSPSPVSAA